MEIVTGVFKSRDEAERAVGQLRALDIPVQKIGIVSPGAAPETLERGVPVTDTEDPGMGKAMGAAVGGAMGAAGGATLGLAVASLAIPGVGPVVAFGMVGAALLGLVGAAAGSAVGDTVEEEMGEGIPHEDVFVYEDAIRHGNSIVIASVGDDQAYRARAALKDSGAGDIDTLREHWWSEVREDERTSYQGDWDSDEPSYRRGYQAALHPRRRGKAYSEVEEDLRSAYAGATLDRPFQAGYERGLSYRPRGENR